MATPKNSCGQYVFTPVSQLRCPFLPFSGKSERAITRVLSDVDNKMGRVEIGIIVAAAVCEVGRQQTTAFRSFGRFRLSFRASESQSRKTFGRPGDVSHLKMVVLTLQPA